MRCDYWTLMIQPRWFVELFELYTSVEAKANESEQQRMKAEMNRNKLKSGVRRGR